MHLETARLCLRPLQEADIPALVALWSDAEVTRFTGGPREPAWLEKTFRADLSDPAPPVYDLWPVVERVGGQLVGHCGLLDKEIDGQPEIELVYTLQRAAWSQGYATEIARALLSAARRDLGLKRLVSLIDPANIASERVALRAGLRYERDVARPGGRQMRLYAGASDAGSE